MPTRHLFIPDTQVQPGQKVSHIEALGNYIAEWKPNVIVIAGDWFDMKALCVYDRDLADVTQRRYQADVDSGVDALMSLMKPWARNKKYKPRLIYTLGNHEERVLRLLDAQPTLRGAVTLPWEAASNNGWEVYPYLKPVTVDGISYCHLFCKSANGLVTNTKWGAPNARTQVLRELRSSTAGHKPGLDFHCQPTSSGRIYGLIAGSFYQGEDWTGPQGAASWRGVVMKHEVRKGQYDPMFVSLNYLLRKWL